MLVYDPDKNPIPVLQDKENWLYLYHDTQYPDTAPSLTLPQLDEILRRNRFAIYANSHFYPLPTTNSLLAELDKALISLAERLLGNYNGVINNRHLVVYYTNNLESCPERPLPRIPEYREYHGTPKRTAPPTPHPTTVTISVYSSDEENNLMAPDKNPITLGSHPLASLSPGEAEHLVAEADVNRITLNIPARPG